jgi:hypothetical protein
VYAAVVGAKNASGAKNRHVEPDFELKSGPIGAC